MENVTRPEKPGPALGVLHEVRGTFANPEQMQQAIHRLSLVGFDRADMSVPEVDAPAARSTPESGALPADTEEDARQARTLHASTAGAAAALAGAGLTIGTGGAAVPAVVAAVAAGAAVGGATYAVSSAANQQEQTELDARASIGRLVLSVRAPTREKCAEGAAILRNSGAAHVTDMEAVGRPADAPSS